MNRRATRTTVACFLCLLMAVAHTTAETRPELKFLRQIELPSIGLKMNIIPEPRELPLPPPATFRYTFTRGEQKWNVEMFSPGELWRQSQHEATWSDHRSNTLTIASISTPYPADKFTREHVPRPEFDKVMAGQLSPSDWSNEDLAKWTDAFTGNTNTTAEILPKPPSRIKSIVRLNLAQTQQALAYAFCINRPGPAINAPASNSWYFAMINLNPKTDRDKAAKAVMEQFFTSIYPSKIVQKQVTASSSYQASTFAGKKQKSPEFIASRQQVADSIKNSKDWWYAETDNYIFLSNMKSKHRVVIKDLQERIEYLRDAFEQFMPPRREIKAVSVIRAFATSEEYTAYVGPKYSWTFGMWVSAQQELVIRPVEWGSNKFKKEEFFKIVFHEAFHQYLFYALDQKQAAAWFNEGHADFFSPATISEKKFSIGEDPENFQIVDQLIKTKTIDINKLLSMSYEDFYTGNNESRKKNYALAWSVIYYLRKGATLDTPNQYAQILDKYVEALWSSGDEAKATTAAFEDIDRKQFQRNFILFWTSEKKRGAALRNNIFKSFSHNAK